MKLNIYQIDTFTHNVFEGNPAAVIILEYWLDDKVMQKIALENNLSETAFCVKESEKYHIRWFTPIAEVDMCGHATLATAFVLFEIKKYAKEKIVFHSKSGELIVQQCSDGKIEMDFPSQQITLCKPPKALQEAFSQKIVACYSSMDYVVVLENEEAVQKAQPDINNLLKLDNRGIIITAFSKEYDFVCRFFAPKIGVYEDSVTGSAFTQLIPYYAQQLNKTNLHAKQISQRGGEVFCSLQGDRVMIAGYSREYMRGSITF